MLRDGRNSLRCVRLEWLPLAALPELRAFGTSPKVEDSSIRVFISMALRSKFHSHAKPARFGHYHIFRADHSSFIRTYLVHPATAASISSRSIE